MSTKPNGRFLPLKAGTPDIFSPYVDQIFNIIPSWAIIDGATTRSVVVKNTPAPAKMGGQCFQHP
jgi:hypothetical protein